jgi:hypothetical protein
LRGAANASLAAHAKGCSNTLARPDPKASRLKSLPQEDVPRMQEVCIIAGIVTDEKTMATRARVS